MKVIIVNFDCSENILKSLKGCPVNIDGWFDCSGNQLETLQDGPTYVGGWFGCNDNWLNNLDYLPTSVGFSIYAYGNSVKFTDKYIESKCPNLGFNL